MTEIVKSNAYTHYLPQLHELFESEWGEVDPFENSKNGSAVPMPILVLNDQQLVGGLAFTRFPAPDTDTHALWVNAVFIKPEFRNQGISDQLIKKSEEVALETDEKVMYVYTDIPKLHEKLGWVRVSQHDDHYILSKILETCSSHIKVSR